MDTFCLGTCNKFFKVGSMAKHLKPTQNLENIMKTNTFLLPTVTKTIADRAEELFSCIRKISYEGLNSNQGIIAYSRATHLSFVHFQVLEKQREL